MEIVEFFRAVNLIQENLKLRTQITHCEANLSLVLNILKQTESY